MKSNYEHNPDNFHVSLKLIVKNKKGQILGLKMPDNSHMPGFYDIPGGRINCGELNKSYTTLIKRETKEELGKSFRYCLIKGPVSMGRHWYFSKKYQKKIYIFFIFFEAEYLGGKIKISDEHIDFKWLTIKNKKDVNKYFVRGLKEGFENYLSWK